MCAICGCSEGAETRFTDSGGNAHAHPHNDGDTHAHGHRHDHHHGEGHTHSHEDPHEHLHGEEHAHLHEHRASVAMLHEPQHGNLLRIEQDVLARNNRMAERNRGWLEGRGVLALNLLSSPGAGKTSLLEKTVRALHSEIEMRVVEGDQETTLDAELRRRHGRADPRGGLPIRAGQHRDRLSSRCVDAGASTAQPRPATWLFTNDRERRQSRMPGAVRSWRGSQNRDPVRD